MGSFTLQVRQCADAAGIMFELGPVKALMRLCGIANETVSYTALGDILSHGSTSLHWQAAPLALVFFKAEVLSAFVWAVDCRL
jgi:hypothetical protein